MNFLYFFAHLFKFFIDAHGLGRFWFSSMNLEFVMIDIGMDSSNLEI